MPDAAPPTESQSSNRLVVNRRIAVPTSEFTLTFARSGGPGGQNVNKVNTKARLEWDVAASPSLPDDVRQRFLEKYKRRINSEGVFQITSQRYRDQARNIDDCLAKLQELLLAVATRPPKRKPAQLSKAAKERRLREKRQQAERKRRRRRPSGDEG